MLTLVLSKLVMNNPNHSQPAFITPDSVKKRLFFEQARLANSVKQASIVFEEAKHLLADFRQMIHNGEVECYAFGFRENGWANNTLLPNGEIGWDKEGSNSLVVKDSICSDLLALEKKGVDLLDFFNEYRAGQEERESDLREHSDF